MIAFLKGNIIFIHQGAVIILVRDIGYRVFCNEKVLNNLQTGEEVELYIYHHLKEDASDLYGFISLSDLEMFSLLLSVSGVGPKSALGVLAIADTNDISQAIMQKDPGLLTKVAGIGKKTAERIVLELKNKIARLPENKDLKGKELTGNSDEIDALMSLGYSLSEARSALVNLPPEITTSAEKVKAALKKIKKI